jgi:hypothetical protein
MKKSVTVDGAELAVATITIGDLESVELAGKTGRKFNIALVAASLLAAGDTEHGTEDWVRKLPAFAPVGTEPPFTTLLSVANEVNGFSAPKPGESEPEAPAQA